MLEEEQRKSLDAARQPMTGDRAIAVGGNVSGSILITGDHNVLEGITSLPTDYKARICNFILEYIGTPQRPVPFGGRQADLQTLDGWLDDPAALPYLLLTAPAGRGKSALLVRWLERRRDLALPVVFVPISLRFNTASQTVFFAALAARLAHLFGERVPADMSQAPDLWRGMASGYLSRPAPDGRLLVVLDGLDEATDWQAGVDLFPFEPPPGLRVVVAARHQANESGPEGWLRRLGWERNGLARSLTLAPLTHAGVSDVLRSMGVPLDALSARVDIVAELYRLSEGDPLLVRLYVDDLWQKGAAATRLQPEDLRTLQPGLHGYFDRWWEDQRKQWGRDAPLREPTVQATLNLLTTALAPLGKDDLLHLSNLSTWDLEEALRPLARLVVGDGRTQGYAFSHPRLGQYFREKLSQHEQRQLEERFLRWGWECVEQLCAGRITPKDVSPYLMRTLGSHLARAQAGPEAWLRLVNGDWATAGEELEGAYSLFLHDVARAWEACVKANREATAQGEPAPWLGGEIRCALMEASLHSLAGNIPPALLVALVQQKVWTSVQGLAYARQMPDPQQRAEALSALVPYLPPDLLPAAFAAIQDIEDEFARARALRALAPHLPPDLLPAAFAAIQDIEDEFARARALRALAPHLPPDLILAAFAAVQDIEDEFARAAALGVLVPHMLPDLRSQAMRDALAAVRDIEDESVRAAALDAFIPHLPPDLLPAAFAAVQDIRDTSARIDALYALVPHLPPDLLPAAFVAVQDIEDKSVRADALGALAPHLPPDLLPAAFAAVQDIEDKSARADALGALVSHLSPDLLPAAFAAVQDIEDKSVRADALGALAPHLPPDLLPAAFAAVQDIEDKSVRADALGALAPHLPSDLLPAALAAIRDIEDEFDRIRALGKLAPHLPPDLLPAALTAAEDIQNADVRADALRALAPHLPPDLLPAALAAIRDIEDEFDRIRALGKLAPHLPSDLLPAAFAIVQDITNESDRAAALTALASHLPSDLLRAAFAAVQDIAYEPARARALRALAPHLPSDLLSAALDAVWYITNKSARTRALSALAPYLSSDLLCAAFAAIRDIEDESVRADTLCALALHLLPDLQSQALHDALAAIRDISDEYARTAALGTLAPRLIQIPRQDLYPMWQETLPVLARRTRRDLLTDLRALVPVIVALGGSDAITATFRAIQDVATQWP
jgi:hypothetical protein